MLKRNLWKIIASLALVAWAVSELLPLHDAPDFAAFAQAQSSPVEIAVGTAQPGISAPPATAEKITFAGLVKQARERTAADPKVSVPMALRQIGHERQLDLTAFFPNIDVGDTLKNIDKRNSVLLTELQRRAKGRIQLGLDLAGGIALTLEVQDKAGTQTKGSTDRLDKAVEIIDRRINSNGVTEPLIRKVGDNRIEVQLPGKTDPELIPIIIKPARLQFRMVNPGFRPSFQPPDEATVPPTDEVLTHEDENGTSPPTYYVVKRREEMNGEKVEQAYVVSDQFGGFQVSLKFTAQGAKDFAALTTANVNHQLAIVLDGKLNSAPNINEPITGGTASISGKFDQREAFELKSVLNNPLDVPLAVMDLTVVGPSLAQDAINSGVTAAIIGTVLVAAFMITFYTTGGLVAVLILAVNIVIILGAMASYGVTMTLPGLAGIVLTIGMAVDANILIFERMREELAAGKSLITSNQSGFMKALTTILDAHLVQLIICAVMISYGAGPIKGFGVTLAIGVLSTLFSVLITGHLCMELLVDSGTMRKLRMFHLLKNARLDFVKLGKPAFIASGLLVVVGFGYVLYQGNAIFGRDFTGGDEISLQFQRPPEAARIRAVAAATGVTDVGVTTVSPLGGGKETLKIDMPEGKGDTVLAAIGKAFPDAGLDQGSVSVRKIGASIGNEILWNALKAVGISMVTILLYIAFRFEFGFGVGAMVSTLHDILMTIGVFVLTGHQFNAPMVAAILCIAGYSINETVVVFDRIREELKLNPTGQLKDVINEAIRKVFARTIMTASTTFLAALALFLFGGGVLRDISFTFLVGIVTSTFSAIFVAAQVFYLWHKGDRKHVEKHADLKPAYEWTGSSKASQ